ncbi:hypothetical protein RBSWK_03406 [Rhodopirellula baltica SWK14]|uniref:Uncharacterized protein n=1 Tax=Rhodopirellula baltica SWK14 TaxID=993516 RepID=L7CHV4_RHOBT|nr:hypothetical protein RBSWK_03406 [Rhodopirellula baltica SWK14]
MVFKSCRNSVLPLLTLIAELRNASNPDSSWPRVGVHIGATWKSVS